jgi:hypothetical protein
LAVDQFKCPQVFELPELGLHEVFLDEMHVGVDDLEVHDLALQVIVTFALNQGLLRLAGSDRSLFHYNLNGVQPLLRRRLRPLSFRTPNP